jgi:hypothetical protein
MDETLDVCKDAEIPNVCQRAGCSNPAKRKYCSDACRQKAYYDAHDGAWYKARRNAWYKARDAYKSITFDGVFSGPRNEAAGRKGQYGYKPDGRRKAIEDLLKP